MNKLDFPNPVFKKYIDDPLQKTGLSLKNVLDLHEDINGKIWIGTDKGFGILDSENENIIAKYNFNDYGMTYESIRLVKERIR